MAELVAKIRSEVKKITLPDIVLVLCAVLSGTSNLFNIISPFGAACVAGLFLSNFSPWSVFFVLVGKLLSGLDAMCLKHLLSYFLLVGASIKESFFKDTRSGILTTSLCMLLSDVIYGAFLGFNAYFVVMSILEIIITAILIPEYKIVADYYTVRKIRRTINKKELTALSVTLCGCLSGMSGFLLPFDISVIGIVSTFILFFCAYNFSLGVCGVLGTVLGVFASLANPEMIFSLGSYSVAAIVCSMCRKYGKAGIVTGFILSNAAVTFYVNGSEEVLINLYEIMIAGGVFAMISVKKLKEMKNEILILLDRKPYHESAKIQGFKEMTFKRLNRIADAFSVLAISMQKVNSKQHTMDDEEKNMLLENIKHRVCGKCIHSEKCRQDESNTDEMIRNLIFMTEKRGWVEQYDVPLYFKNRCLDFVKLVLECNKVFELYRVNQVWENRIAENRSLISGQLKGVSGVMKSLADELYETLSFEEELEQSIISVLDGLGIKLESAEVIREANNRLSVSMRILNCNGKNVCEREIRTVLKKVTGKTFSPAKQGCDNECCRIKFKEQENFAISVGVSRVRPGSESKSGDSYAIIRPGSGKVVIALSDGMGTGERAAKESGETVTLLEHLLLAGIDKNEAIKLINSVLILKSYDESFATLDLLIVDLYTGEGEFVKTGGATSYITRAGQIARISANTLPTGIIGEMESANRQLLLCNGDSIMIASDGITDVCRDDKWICDTLLACDRKSAQETADIIMKEAQRRVFKCRDDMTVLIVKVSEK